MVGLRSWAFSMPSDIMVVQKGRAVAKVRTPEAVAAPFWTKRTGLRPVPRVGGPPLCQDGHVFTEACLGPGAVVWRSRNDAPAEVPADGCVDLIADGDAVRVCGPQTRWLCSPGTDARGMLGLRLSAGTALRLLPECLPELRDQVVGLDSELGGSAPLRDLMLRAWESADPLAGLDSLLPALDVPEPWILLASRAASAGLRAPEAARRLDCSERTLRRRMLFTFGYSYTTLLRIRRAERARTLIAGGTGLAGAAAHAGYADQAHMCRDFARLVGASPGQWEDRAAKRSTALPSGSSTVA